MLDRERVQQALDLIRIRSANHDYFFEKLSSSDWISPLDDAGLFATPPPAIYEGDKVSFPFWPESQYLARMAAIDPERVAAVVERIPATDNVRVHEDLAKAAKVLPPYLAAKWARREAEWIETQHYLYLLLPTVLGELVHYLAENGEPAAALRLARALLRIESPGDKDDLRAHFDNWSYGQILRDVVPRLIPRTGLNGLRWLCDLLASALSDSPKESSDDEDLSWLWRPAIEPNEQNLGDNEIRDSIVDAVRDSAVALVYHGVNKLAVVQILNDRRRLVFARIRLYLLAQSFPDLADAAMAAVTDKGNFVDGRVHHEYSRLLATVFPKLPDAQKDLVLSWIEEGPEIDSAELVDPQTRQMQKAHWQARRLYPVRDALPDSWKTRYRDIVADVGEPEHPDFLIYHSAMWAGPTSPMTSQELEQLSAADIALYLKTWNPSNTLHSPTPEGLGRTFQSVVAKVPEKFHGDLLAFRLVDPTYARALVLGLADAIEAGKSIDWPETIRFLAWIADQPIPAEAKATDALDQDPHWGWARKASARLLGLGFDRDLIGASLRAQVWAVIEKFLEDPDPPPHDDDKPLMDPLTMSLNTTRGEAMHTLIRYSLWVRRAMGVAEPTERERSFDQDEIVEARKQLERHLDLKVDGSPAIRAVYGRWFPWLVLLDKAWAKRHAAVVFPAESQILRDAAWNAYLAMCPVYNDTFEILKWQYEVSVEHLGPVVGAKDLWLGNASEHLGKHLLTLVGRGVLTWLSDNGLVNRYFHNAPGEVAANVVAFVGEQLSFRHSVSDLEVQHLMDFWEALRNSIGLGETDRTSILKAFGAWFASGRFNEEWAHGQLMDVIQVCGGVTPEFLVIKRLADVAPRYPGHALTALKALIRADKRGWGLFGWEDGVRNILKAGMNADETRTEAQATIHELGARGHVQYRDLLA